MTHDPLPSLECLPQYWRGRASARRPESHVDIWSAEALRDHQRAAEYELYAEQCEARKPVER